MAAVVHLSDKEVCFTVKLPTASLSTSKTIYMHMGRTVGEIRDILKAKKWVTPAEAWGLTISHHGSKGVPLDNEVILDHIPGIKEHDVFLLGLPARQA